MPKGNYKVNNTSIGVLIRSRLWGDQFELILITKPLSLLWNRASPASNVMTREKYSENTQKRLSARKWSFIHNSHLGKYSSGYTPSPAICLIEKSFNRSLRCARFS